MSLQVEFDVTPPLPDDIPENIVVPHVSEAINRIEEEDQKFIYATTVWDMRPIMENYKKLVLYNIIDKLNDIKYRELKINTNKCMQNAWDMYMVPNLDKYQLTAIYKKYTQRTTNEYFFNTFFHKEIRKPLENLLTTGGWIYYIGDYYGYNTSPPDIKIELSSMFKNKKTTKNECNGLKTKKKKTRSLSISSDDADF